MRSLWWASMYDSLTWFGCTNLCSPSPERITIPTWRQCLLSHSPVISLLVVINVLVQALEGIDHHQFYPPKLQRSNSTEIVTHSSHRCVAYSANPRDGASDKHDDTTWSIFLRTFCSPPRRFQHNRDRRMLYSMGGHYLTATVLVASTTWKSNAKHIPWPYSKST